jgi:MFS family permease
MSERRLHPIVFMFLILPFGMMSGYLTVAVAYTLAKAGASVEQIAGLIAISFIPHTWKFAWAPIADTTLSRKSWYVIAAVLSAVGFVATGALPATPKGLHVLSIIVVVANVAITFLGMSVESLMAYDAREEEKGRAGGWFQAGNLGGAGLGGGAGLWFAQHLPAPWMSGVILAVATLLCCSGLVFVSEPLAEHRARNFLWSLWSVARDGWEVARHRRGFLALFLCFLPIGSGAAANLWSAVATNWNASADTVALVTGVLGGLISAVGCVVGGWICDRMDRKTGYVLYGILQALCAIGMALAPRTETTFVIFTSIYAFITGLTYAGFTAFVLEAIGRGAAATKYNVYASLSNAPIAYMTQVDGHAHSRHGPAGMLYTEAVYGFIGLALFVTVVGVTSAFARKRDVPSPALPGHP